MKSILCILGVLLAFGPASAQFLVHPGPERELSHSLRADFLYHDSFDADAQQAALGRTRSIPLAGAMSAAVPGLGQAYNRQWIKAAVFAAAEVAMWTGFVVWKNQGLDREREFEAFARQHWSPKRYSEWLSGYSGYPGDPIPDVPYHIDFSRPERWSDADWREVQAFIERIRAAESVSRYLKTNALFSHKLYEYGHQQYYEMIGKYFQYAPGWDDYNGANDPLETVDGQFVNVSDRFYEYAGMHLRANDLLRRASRLTSFILVNHFLSAIDAAIFAKLHNDRVEKSLSVQYDQSGALMPVAVFRLTF